MRGYLYQPGFVTADERRDILAWLATIQPLWEQRFSTLRPPPRGEAQRALLRPVYWLGNWQFACLNYYHPLKRPLGSAVAAEPFPPPLARLVARAEARARKSLPAADVPRGWTLNTCLVNYYGSRVLGGREEDVARVGSHADDEPGPVASVSFGERALLQFVPRGGASRPVKTEWLEDSSLQVFAGPELKERLLHRVQRVEDKLGQQLAPQVEGYRTRRINLTLRYVPAEHVVPLSQLSAQARDDVAEYVTTLARTSAFWAQHCGRLAQAR